MAREAATSNTILVSFSAPKLLPATDLYEMLVFLLRVAPRSAATPLLGNHLGRDDMLDLGEIPSFCIFSSAYVTIAF